MKVSSFKIILTTLGFAACLAMSTGCNKGYGCPSDFSVDACTEMPATITPSC